MKKEEIMSEIAKLEAEAKQMLANANFITGAVHAYNIVLSRVIAAESAAESEAKL